MLWVLPTILRLVSIEAKENAVIFILCRNEDLDGIKESLKTFEETFNRKYKYPYLFLNNVDFTDHFKNSIKSVTNNTIEFGKLNSTEWGPPSWIDMKRAEQNMKTMEKNGVIYGGSLSYRNMCRFYSGYFYRHELALKYDYYWRIEPGVKFFCKMNYDPFTYLRENNKEYGFVISVLEHMSTIPSLWSDTIEFLRFNRSNLTDSTKILNFILNPDKTYNGCHFWSNFEIASFKFFRNPLYQSYFDWLDKKGGFYYERWGDAPVHSIAAALFLGRDKVYFFEDIGYEHPPFMHCPSSPSRLVDCKCSPKNSIDLSPFSCMKKYQSELLAN
ncbi:O-glycoside alpha-1,2-mannosyltransferase omh1 [Astathelohania contejeani]|uniref:O-glycoside alpha-1,2-mannosyltransferase omh1 n=1 Tax=Astathelohania contejeani TaxID=164912 RepID=A0ABQ7I1K6_9MICR|nr:O-glycoside alpha-1,2-mannosyltransferase omh1 [Thelohania contejeani]